jgi:hypothetical protein
MSIFRVEKNANYTVISNYHLRDKNLSLKTIGLLSLILSLPDTWDYSQAGLASICKDGEDSIRSGLKELEKYGYLERKRDRDYSGRMRGIIYHIYEIPKNKSEEIGTTIFGKKQKMSEMTNKQTLVQQSGNSPERENPILDKPVVGNPVVDFPMSDSPCLELPRQGNDEQRIKDVKTKDIRITERPNTEEQNTEFLNIHPSIYPEDRREDRMIDNFIDSETDRKIQRDRIRKRLMDNVGYEFFEFKHNSLEKRFENGEMGIEEYDEEILRYDLRAVDKVLEYMLDILLSLNKNPIKIGNELIDREVVRGKLIRVGIQEMKRVVYELNTNPMIKNPKNYAISMLYNA